MNLLNFLFLLEYNGNGGATGFNLYINNVLITRSIIINNIGTYDFNGNSNFKFGCYYNDTSPFLGIGDELAVWNRVLTAGEKTSLYNGGLGLQYPF